MADMSIPDAAERLGVSRVTAWEWAKEGVFPNAYQLNPDRKGSPWRVPEADVIALEEKRKRRQTNESQTNDD